MQYHLDTIPVWEAMEWKGECPLCSLERKTEVEEIERTLGASVMVAPVGAVQLVQTDGAAGARRMHEAAFADIDADVIDLALAEKDQIARSQALAIHLRGGNIGNGL